jgi:hypothetical protein
MTDTLDTEEACTRGICSASDSDSGMIVTNDTECASLGVCSGPCWQCSAAGDSVGDAWCVNASITEADSCNDINGLWSTESNLCWGRPASDGECAPPFADLRGCDAIEADQCTAQALAGQSDYNGSGKLKCMIKPSKCSDQSQCEASGMCDDTELADGVCILENILAAPCATVLPPGMDNNGVAYTQYSEKFGCMVKNIGSVECDALEGYMRYRARSKEECEARAMRCMWGGKLTSVDQDACGDDDVCTQREYR